MQWDAMEQKRKKMKKGRTKTGTKLDMRTETEKTGTTARATHIKRMADKCRHHKLSLDVFGAVVCATFLRPLRVGQMMTNDNGDGPGW